MRVQIFHEDLEIVLYESEVAVFRIYEDERIEIGRIFSK